MRVNPAPAENYGAAPQRPVNAPPFTPYTQVRPAAPAQNHEAYQVPAEVSAKPKKKKSAGSVVATIFLAFSMFVFLLVAAVLISVRTFTSEDVIKSTMEKVEFTDIMDAANGFISTDQENEDFTDVFYNNLNIKIKEKTGENIERRKLEKAINKTTIMEFLAEKMAQYVSDVFNNDREFELDQNEVEQLLDENYAVIKEEFGIRNLDSVQKRETIESIADTLVADDVIEDITPSAIKKSNPAIYNAMNIGFSWPVIIVLLILVALLAFLMIKNDLSQAAVGSGVVCCIIGGIFTVAGLLALMSPGILEAVFGNMFFGTLACGFLTANLPMFAVILVVGIGALAARGIVLKVNSKR